MKLLPAILALAIPLPATAVDFATEIQPLLKEHCVKCHGPEKQKGGLRLDSKAAAFRGGDSGEPAIVPGQAQRSPLYRAVSSRKDDERMPPKGDPLNAQQLALLRRWIEAGAQWPELAAATAKAGRSEMKVTEADRQHWSFLPLRAVQPPQVQEQGWVRTPVDQFVRQAQEEKGVTPSSPADARTLVRRIFFDLVGLPPTPEELNAWTFRLEQSRDAVGPLVDELLARPQHGERWARHWLDVARYADSSGMESDHDRPNAYRYRDFVIRALNRDMPFDEFVRWQLAGDEISPDEPDAIAATGFIAAGVNAALPDKLLEEERLRNRADELDDMVSTTAQAMLGLTLACARCHDHKYDPLPTRDYYRLMRVFNSGDRAEVPLAPLAEAQAQRAAMAQWQPRFDAATKERDDWVAKARGPFVQQVRAEKIAKLPLPEDDKLLLTEKPTAPEAKKLANRFKAELKIEDAEYVAFFSPEQKARWAELNDRVSAIAKAKPETLPVAFAFADFGPEPRESWFFERGNFMARNEKMELGFLTVLTNGRTADDYWKRAAEAKRRDDTTQQRGALAEWITDLDHGAGALLARVIVNRVWQHHFGDGLVRTVSDFGSRGEAPTHPELLEWLTGEFIRSGWSLKHLHRLIVNSATYQQASTLDAAKAAADSENRLLWRHRPMRLESEALRDAMLAAAGTLNPRMFGPSFKPPIPAEAMQARNVKDPYPSSARDTPETRRRSVYLFHKRVVQYPLMQAFDAPDAQQSCARRMNTTVAPQALALFNDPFVRLRAEELAARLQTSVSGGLDERIRAAFQLCLSRAPAAEELPAARAFIEQQSGARQQREANAATAERQALTDFCQSLFGLNEFIYVD